MNPKTHIYPYFYVLITMYPRNMNKDTFYDRGIVPFFGEIFLTDREPRLRKYPTIVPLEYCY